MAEIVDVALDRRGHWLITANLDHLRRYRRQSVARHLLDSADIVVADGAPLVWASRIAGTPLPERVAGSDMIWAIGEAAAQSDAGLFLLGGNTGVAEQAADVLRQRSPGLRICGTLCPPRGFDTDQEQLAQIEKQVQLASPDVVLVALGFPKQDLMIERLRRILPHSSFVGIGISLSFVAGELRRSPKWTQRLGLEWIHRLMHEPARLAHRYLVKGIPFAIWLLASAAWYRIWSRTARAHETSAWGWDEVVD